MNDKRFPILIVAFLLAGSTAPLSASDLPADATPAPQLASGDSVPAFEATGLDGVSHRVGFEKGSKTVLLFFLAGCPACHKMMPEWNRAYERRPKGLTIYGVLMNQEPPGYFMATPLAFPVLRAPVGEFAKTYKLFRVPVSLRVGAGGRVEDVGVGQLDAMRLGEIFRP
jgi:hypothetical protein